MSSLGVNLLAKGKLSGITCGRGAAVNGKAAREPSCCREGKPGRRVEEIRFLSCGNWKG